MEIRHTFAVLAYKESPHLQDCIDSLKKQSAPSEIILCTSTPSAFLENIASRNNLELFVNPERAGIASDWNFALRKAGGDLVTLAHQDDIYAPTYAEEISQTAGSQEDILILFSDYDELVCKNDQTCIRQKSLNFFIKNILLKASFGKKTNISRNKHRLLALGNPIGCPTVTFNKKNISDFKFDASFSINMDWKAWMDLARKEGSFVWLRKTLVSHRIYAESETSRGLADNRRQEEDRRIFRMFWPQFFANILAKIYSLSYKNNT